MRWKHLKIDPKENGFSLSKLQTLLEDSIQFVSVFKAEVFDMNITKTPLLDCLILEPKVFEDSRGFFFESYNAKKFSELTGVTAEFVQDNHSRSLKGVLRGLHYQIRKPQGKLVRVTQGAVYDVSVDLRKSSKTYGRWHGILLSAINRLQLWVPPGFAHGFLVVSDAAEVQYKTTDFYSPALERCLLWNDPTLNIDWQFPGVPELSEKDRAGVLLTDAEVFE